ncbi:hypothetical protein K435DRAFT_705157 [Dendrothele bispora CBS 962.96]|uniref:DUF4218 domain-containing protein n=1 Tax=Dendrothele bispora (strain CBS 962.96) TaxID=1314807 RepID=A0A4S8KL38_DENBC|nr:hypothetical protein K435DRAFT_705157 [Dendrothele bispora CBS 962.96]
MHLIWENLIKNLLKLWTGDFKGMDSGREDYELEKSVWDSIGEATAASGSTIPSAYGARVPNVASDGVYLTADMLSFWTTYIGPNLLRGRFKHVRYYNHFIRLVRLLNICLQFEITSDELDEVHAGFISWVEDYERFYYQYDAQRLPTCPVTIHALLHIAPSIKGTGPVWCYWAFPMERYCGKIQPAIQNRRFPYACLARHVLEDARLTQIKSIYNVAETLSLCPPRLGSIPGTFTDPSYPTCRLHPPRNPQRPDDSTLTLLVGAMVTRFNENNDGTVVTPAIVRECLKEADIEEWGKIHRIDSDVGDRIRASELGSTRDDSRDASFVRYEMYVDQNATLHNVDPEYELETFYGQLLRVYLIRFCHPCPELNLFASTTTFIMASIKTCKILTETIPGLDIHFYSSLGKTDVIDITSVQCLVGRIACGRNKWALIDRSGTLARAQRDVKQADENEHDV